MFKKFLSKVPGGKSAGPASPTRQTSNEGGAGGNPAGGGSGQPGKEAEGFLCPMCMNQMPSPEALQAHFDAVHDPEQSKGPQRDE